MTEPSNETHAAERRVSIDALVTGALFLVALLLRWPFRGTALEEFDSVNFAMAVTKLDLPHHFPHPPGYLFLVWAARLVNAVVHDPVVALSSLSALCGAASVAVVYRLARAVLGRTAATGAAVAYLFAAQSWFQHVRPMSDAHAALWELLVVLAFVATWGRSGGRGYLAFFLFGACGGAKQLLGLFLVGLFVHALVSRWRQYGWADAARACAAVALGVLLWLAPLVALTGSPAAYLAWVNDEVSSQQPRETIFVATSAMLRQQAVATFARVWLRAPWPAIVWPLAAVGIWAAARRREWRWLLSTTLPIVVVRFAFLGYWPRFGIYYAPLVLILAALGAARLCARAGRFARPLALAAGAVLAAFCLSQCQAILPTLRTLRHATSPVGDAVAFAAARFGAERTLVLCDHAVLGRQAVYYAQQRGLKYVFETRLTPEHLRGIEHVVKVQLDDIPRAPSVWSDTPQKLGDWQREIPRWKELSPADVWNASLFELPGAYTVFRNWREEVDAQRGVLRYARRRGSTLQIVRPPRRGFMLRLSLAGPYGPGPEREAEIVINRNRRVSWRGESELTVAVSAQESRGLVVIDVVPRCENAVSCLPVQSYEVVAAS